MMLITLAILAAAQVGDPAAAPPPDLVCRNLQVTGSVMKRRECRTKAEWKEIDRRNRAMTDRATEDILFKTLPR